MTKSELSRRRLRPASSKVDEAPEAAEEKPAEEGHDQPAADQICEGDQPDADDHGSDGDASEGPHPEA